VRPGALRRGAVVAALVLGAAMALDLRGADAAVPDAGWPARAPAVLEGAGEVSCWTMVRQDGGWFWKGLPVRGHDGGTTVPLNRFLPPVPAVLDGRERAVLQVNADRRCVVVEAGCACGGCRPLAQVGCPFSAGR